MTATSSRQRLSRTSLSGLLAAAALMLVLPACGSSSVRSGVAVGRMGQGLTARAQSAPQGFQVCAMKDALQQAPGAEKTPAEQCEKAATSDALWRKAMEVLGAHASRLEALASGAKPEQTGQLEAAQTNVKSATWIETEDSSEQAARNAVHQLVTQIGAGDSKSDLEKSIQDAAPHVKTICDGLGPYLEAQVQGAGEVQAEVAKKRAQRGDRRCVNLDNRPICFSESVLDRMVVADFYATSMTLERNHLETRDALTAFCESHRKLEQASKDGKLSKNETYSAVVETVKSSPRAKSYQETSAAAAEEKKAQ